MKHNKIIILFLLLTIIPFVTSFDSIGTIKQNECVNISQMCSTCSYVNISSIGTKLNPDLVTNEPMSYFGNGEWRYGFCNTSEVARYDVKGQGDINGVDSNFATYFDVTYNGTTENDYNIYTLAFLTIFFSAIFLFSIYFKKNWNEEKWYNSVKTKYEDKNWIKLVFSALFFTIVKNIYVIYYILGFLIISLLAYVIFLFNII